MKHSGDGLHGCLKIIGSPFIIVTGSLLQLFRRIACFAVWEGLAVHEVYL